MVICFIHPVRIEVPYSNFDRYALFQLFNGFYKHNIEGILVGGELMLELMGYRKVRDNLLVFEDPIDPDRVSGVSKDSMIASVECQVSLSCYSVSYG